MKKTILLNLLPTEIWLYIYRIEHNIKYLKIINEMKSRVVFIQIDKNTNTFFVCKNDNPFRVLAVF